MSIFGSSFTVLAGVGLLLSQTLAARELPLDATASIREQGQSALSIIQEEQYRDMLARTQDHLMPPETIVIPSPSPRVAVQIRLRAKLALLAIREQLLAKYRTGFAARQLAFQDYRVRTRVAAGSVKNEPGDSTLERAQALFKSAKFEWPEFMPRGLR